MNRIAILHGGPADRVQIAVERFPWCLYWAVPPNLPLIPAPGEAYGEMVKPLRAVYEQAMPAWDVRKKAYQGHYGLLPDQAVCRYVYVGTE